MTPLALPAMSPVAITLSAIAYKEPDGSPVARFKAMAKALQQADLPTKQQWGLVWGPHEHEENLAFIVQGPKPTKSFAKRQYAVVVRGTIESVRNIFEDLDVLFQQDLPFLAPDFPGAKISWGSADGWKALKELHQYQAGTRVGIVDFLRKTEPGAEITVTGHSLGGNLASVVAAWLHSELNHPKPTHPVRPLTFAAPTAGNGAFAASFDKIFPATTRIANELDLVPRFWAYPDLESIRSLYPGLGTPKCDILNLCQGLVSAAEDAVGHQYQQPTHLQSLPSWLYDESGLLSFWDEAEGQHSALLYMWLMGVPVVAIQKLYPSIPPWTPPPHAQRDVVRASRGRRSPGAASKAKRAAR